MTKTCARAGCGATYEAKRATAKYCSPRCRAYASRDRAPAPMGEPPTPLVGAPLQMVDMASFDARVILATIAANDRLPAAARVSAAKALLPKPKHEADEELGIDAISRKAIAMLNAGRLN
jgi:hypothetical protein